MRIISKRALREFWERHPEAERRLRLWYQVVDAAEWGTWDDVRRTFPAADLVGRFAVFNVGGNNYRVITRIEFKWRRVYIRQVLTHSEYNTDAWKRDPWF
ncbi:MAG: type II toxin-antitoxin system HigB family toxin [Chloroflexi bacterium]|nr:type II toxin-antitoxin system HigB family toxin [Chloroflexota bacterium]